MNNRRLLIGLCFIVLMGYGGYAADRESNVITIENLFELAETNSKQLRPYFTAEQESLKEIEVARSNRLPDINTSLSLSFIGDGFTTKRNFADYQRAPIPHFGNGLSINISQPIYSGGAITTGIELADLKSAASRFSTELQRDNIRLRVAGAYLDIYKFYNLKAVVTRNLDNARTVLGQMKDRVDQGVALQNDITRYELLVSNLELQIVKIDNMINILNNNLVKTVGLPDGTIIEPDSAILAKSLPNKSECVWQNDALESSPVLKLASSGVDMSRKTESLVKSERLPKIGVQAGWTLDGPILVEVPPINRNLSYWYIGVGVSYNLASLYKNNHSLTKSRIATRRAVDSYEAAKEDISLGINADYIKYLEAYEELKTQEKSVELANRNYNITSTRFSADMALLTDMIDAANSKLESEQQLVNARINIIYYYYKLLFTSGKI